MRTAQGEVGRVRCLSGRWEMTFKVARECELEVVPVHKGYKSKWEASKVFKLFLGKMIYSI